MYVDGAGTWFTTRITVSAGGAIDADFDYDHAPEWSISVDPVAYVTDLERFPREESARPSWLRDRVVEARPDRS